MRPVGFVVLVLGVLGGPAVVPAQDYRVVKTAVLGGEGGWDYLTVDEAARRLYVSHSTHVVVVDADTLEPLGDIPDTAGVHGIAIASELGRGYVSCGRANAATIFDLQTLEKLGEVKTGENPDSILYDASSGRVFTFNGRSADATAFDARTGEVLATIPLGGKPEFSRADGRGRVFVNVEDTSELVVINAHTLSVATRWSLAPCEEPTGLAFDEAHGRLFSACGNSRMAVSDAEAGRVVTTLPIGEGADGAAFDAATGLAFSSNGRSGTLTVVRELSPDAFEVVADIPTQRSARTMTLDTRTHRLFLPAAELEAPQAPVAGERPARPRPVAGTFRVLVMDRQPQDR